MVDAVEDLYLRERTPQDAAQALLDLARGSNLGARPPPAPTPSVAPTVPLVHSCPCACSARLARFNTL